MYIHVNVHGSGVLGQTGHRHDAAADNDHKARTGAQTHLAHIQRVTLGRTRQLGVVAEGILRFGNADRQDSTVSASALPPLPPLAKTSLRAQGTPALLQTS